MEDFDKLQDCIDSKLIIREFDQYFSTDTVREFVRDFTNLHDIDVDYQTVEEMLKDIRPYQIINELEQWLPTCQKYEFIDWICKIYGIYDEDEK